MTDIVGKLNSITYTISQELVDRLMSTHGIDAIKEIEQAIAKHQELTTQIEKNENKSTE